ncbi:MAG: carbamoyltransferase HypF [Candidatus Bathyarchaeia archaeon]
MRVRIKVVGVVQGVGFRPFVYRVAKGRGLKGFIRNTGDAGVEIIAEGEPMGIEGLLSDLRNGPPPMSKIESLSVEEIPADLRFEDFSILASDDRRESPGSIIPPDISICDECLMELRDRGNRRFDYFFITCTNCGPRFTIIERPPYDRVNTTMKEFDLCESCAKEYSDPSDRRFHAQTIACAACGPAVALYDRNGAKLGESDPIRAAGRLLEEGAIIAIKGIGGYHMAISTLRSDAIARARRFKHRRQKPFAIMARDLETVRTFAFVSEAEESLLTSYSRPIVLLKKRDDFYLSELISPGLHNIGVMLPYTGLHSMLFDGVGEPAFVMTSANFPGEPIIKDDGEAFERLRDVVDYFLIHNRAILHRCDDSVVRVNGAAPVFIRRSRGFVPLPISLSHRFDHHSIGIGAESNVSSCVLKGELAYPSQYIGDVESPDSIKFLRDATEHLLMLTGAEPRAIGCDLHPSFHTTALAEKLGEKLGIEVVRVQHHHAHLLGLMEENGLEEAIGIVCDGYGYGLDGQAWGGEIFYCDGERIERIGHLQEHPLPGGDLAARYPARIVVGALLGRVDIEGWLFERAWGLPHGPKEAEAIISQAKKGAIKTTSLGRILDAIAALLDICWERTYEGEPAMKLEAMASKGRDVLGLEPELDGGILRTDVLLEEVFSQRDRFRKEDLARSSEEYLARGLAELACDEAEARGIKAIGFTGGVAYNEHITKAIRERVEGEGYALHLPKWIPPGDNGISIGQAIFASRALERRWRSA